MKTNRNYIKLIFFLKLIQHNENQQNERTKLKGEHIAFFNYDLLDDYDYRNDNIIKLDDKIGFSISPQNANRTRRTIYNYVKRMINAQIFENQIRLGRNGSIVILSNDFLIKTDASGELELPNFLKGNSEAAEIWQKFKNKRLFTLLQIENLYKELKIKNTCQNNY